jgi:two-component system, OmpR family, osmolarity sensor histidine kinase EnvZ
VLKSLRGRNIVLMAAMLLLGQVLAMLLVSLFVIGPQANRVAGILARNVRIVGATLDALAPGERTRFVARVNRSGAFKIQPGHGDPPGENGRPTLLETAVLRSVAADLGQQGEMVWRGGGGQALWVRVRLGDQGYYWISLAPTPGWSPNGALVGSVAAALILSLAAGLALQRRVNRPLNALAEAIDAMPDTQPVRTLAGHGPIEIASVAQSFERMAARLSAQEADRAFMLAGISHDLKTPIAKLRLAAALSPSGDEAHDAMIERQLDRLDRMLDQFLDFGRGTDAEPPEPVEALIVIRGVLDALGFADRMVAHDTSALVFVRPVAFERTLTNLIRNALLHGAEPVAVALGAQSGMAIITVRDAGPGVEPWLLDRLGEPFVRGDASRPSDGGVGLGLAIAARFAHQHDGHLRFANRPEGGFEAVLTLPLYKRPSASSA